MKRSKETIYHFNCEECRNWWSYATMEESLRDSPWYCPHCGVKQAAIWLSGQEEIEGVPV